MSFEIYLHPKADEFLNSLDLVIAEKIKNRLRELVEEPDKKGETLTPTLFKKIRIGVYRAIYEIIWTDSRVNVLFIGHRSNVYDDFKRIFL